MSRKLNIPKDKQIKGLKKAIANRKTPRQFIPSMKKRLKKLMGTAAGILFLCYLTNSAAFAQTPVVIVPNQQTLATAASCTGAAQVYAVNNRNLTQHIASVISSGPFTKFAFEIDGLDNQGNVFRLSDTGLGSQGTTGNIISAVGYYPTIQVSVTCTGSATYTLSYSGFSAAPFPSTGMALGSMTDKQLITSAAANTNAEVVFQSPYGNSSGTILFTYGSTGPSGSTILLTCEGVIGPGGGGLAGESFTFTLATTGSLIQTFNVPPTACPEIKADYVSGGASAVNYSLEYFFNPTGAAVNVTLGVYTHITGTTATTVKATAGTFLGLNVNTSAAGTVSIFDLATAACTGTPSTNTVAVLTVNATDPPHATPFNLYFSNGICVKASVAMDLTAGSQ